MARSALDADAGSGAGLIGALGEAFHPPLGAHRTLHPASGSIDPRSGPPAGGHVWAPLSALKLPGLRSPGPTPIGAPERSSKPGAPVLGCAGRSAGAPVWAACGPEQPAAGALAAARVAGAGRR